MQRRTNASPGTLGEPVSAELLARSRTAQVLWARRGQHAGVSLTELCARAGRTVEAALAQVAAAQRFLTRTRSVWAIASEDRETEEGAQERYFWLIAPHCPRPAARKILPLAEPEFVSLEEVEEEFPILPHWAGPDGKITPTVE